MEYGIAGDRAIVAVASRGLRRVVAFLNSDAASFVTGTTPVVDGGWTRGAML